MSSNNILSQSKKTTLVKLTQDNVQNLYPELSRYIDYNLDMSINTIDEEYTKLLGKDFKNSNGTPNLNAIYSQVLTDIGRLVIWINSELLSIEQFDKYMMRYMQSNNTNNEPPSSVDDLKIKLSQLFPTISVLNNDEILSAMFDVSKETTGNKWALIPYIYYIYNSSCGITDNNLIIILMVSLQQGVASSSFNVAKETYQQLAFDIDVGGGSSIDKWFAGYRETRLHIYQNIRSTQSIKVNKPVFAFYTDNKYSLFAVDTAKYIDFNANKVFNLMKQPEWRNDAIKTTYELIQNLGSDPVDIETGKLMAKVIFKDYKNASIQPLLANIFARFLTDSQKGAETYETLQKFITDILNETKEDMIVKNLTDFDNALKTNPDDFVASMTQSIEKYNSCKDQLDLSCKESEQPLPIDINSYSRLKQFQMWLKQVVKSVYDNTISMSAEDDDISIELGKSAIVWVNKAAEWADKDSIAEVQGAVEQIQGISSKLDALAKLYNDKNIQPDDPVAVDFNNMKNTINHNAKLVNAALNVALSIVIIRAIRQSNGIGNRVDVVDSVLKAALDSVRQVGAQVQTGGADNNDPLKQADTKAKDLYDIAMALLNMNAEVMEEAAKSNPVIVNDRSILANTLTILMNTKIPGKRILKYDPKMTIPGVNSSYVCFDPRVKLKQSIVNNVQPTAPIQYGGMFPFTQTATTSAAQNDAICMQFFRRNEFNSLLLRTMNESPQEIYGLKDAKDMGITDNNIQVTLDTLFRHGNVMYIQGAPYTINICDWIYGDWQIDTRPNINLPQLQMPIITSYGVIIPNRSNIAMFEKEAKRERDTIPADAQKGDALESGSKIRKAIRSVLSPVTQNVKVNVTPNDIVKPISTWALTELLEQQKRNKKPAPVSVPAQKSTPNASVGPVSAKQSVVPGPPQKSTPTASVGPVSAPVPGPAVSKSVVVPAPAPAPAPAVVQSPTSTPTSGPAPGLERPSGSEEATDSKRSISVLADTGFNTPPSSHSSRRTTAPTTGESTASTSTNDTQNTQNLMDPIPPFPKNIPATNSRNTSDDETDFESTSGESDSDASLFNKQRASRQIKILTPIKDIDKIDSRATTPLTTPVEDNPSKRRTGPIYLHHPRSRYKRIRTGEQSGGGGDLPEELIKAVKENNINVVKDALQMNTSLVNAKDDHGTTLLMYACNDQVLDIVRLLIDNYAADVNLVDTDGETALHLASSGDNLDIVKLLLDKGAKVNQADNIGNTPLNIAATNSNNLEIIRILLEKGAEVNQVDNNGDIPLANACDRKNEKVDIVQLLLSKGGNIQFINEKNNKTLLHYATQKRFFNIVKLLLEKGAQILINHQDELGNTPLHIACKNGDEDIALLLLKYNANATIQNKAGKTPLNVCKTNQLCIDLITNIVKRDLPKSTSNRNADVVVNDNDDSIKKSLSYYLKDPQKTEAKNSYYVVVDLDLHPGTSISTAQKLRMQCARVFDNIQEARADIKGVDYVPQEMTIPEAVPIPSAKTRTRKNANRFKGGRTKRRKNKGRKSKQTRKNTRVKRRRNSRRRAKK